MTLFRIVCLLKFAAYIQIHSRLVFIMKANTKNLDKTPPRSLTWEQCDLGPYCLQYSQPKYKADERADDNYN